MKRLLIILFLIFFILVSVVFSSIVKKKRFFSELSPLLNKNFKEKEVSKIARKIDVFNSVLKKNYIDNDFDDNRKIRNFYIDEFPGNLIFSIFLSIVLLPFFIMISFALERDFLAINYVNKKNMFLYHSAAFIALYLFVYKMELFFFSNFIIAFEDRITFFDEYEKRKKKFNIISFILSFIFSNIFFFVGVSLFEKRIEPEVQKRRIFLQMYYFEQYYENFLLRIKKALNDPANKINLLKEAKKVIDDNENIENNVL